MYTKEIFAGMDLYSLFIVVGVILCMVFIRLQGEWRGMRAKLQNFILMTTVAVVVLGYGCAVLLQAFYNYMAKGTFELTNTTGATFYGGLLGGTALYIIIYFAVGHFLFPDGYHKRHFRNLSDLAAACITVGHGFGRLGCLMAGCCYGRRTDAWYGISMNLAGDGSAEKFKVIPVQLYEALFLFALAGIFLFLYKKGKKYLLPSYMIAYAIWRFIAEALRDDYRGESLVRAMTPSQLISVILLAGGLLLLGIELWLDSRPRTNASDGGDEPARATVGESAEETAASEGDTP